MTNNHYNRWVRRLLAPALALAMVFAPAASQAFVTNLEEAPDIRASIDFIDFDTAFAPESLVARGMAEVLTDPPGTQTNILTDPGTPIDPIFGLAYEFLINADVLADGSIGGGGGILEIYGLLEAPPAGSGVPEPGQSGTLLTGDLVEVSSTSSQIALLFDSLGGDLASRYGDTATVVLTNFNQPNNYNGDFSSAFLINGAAANIGVSREFVPEPGTLALVLLGGLLLRRRLGSVGLPAPAAA